MNPVLAEILSTKRVLKRDGTTIPLDYNISDSEGTALQRLIREVKPRVTLEIGMAYGISTLYICEALKDVGGERHIVIDPGPVEGWLDAGLFNVERAGYASLLEFHNDSSHRVLPALEREGRRVGVAVIDGWHTFDYTFVDFFYVDRLLDVGGVVMFDDAEYYPAIRKVARYVATHRRYAALANEPVRKATTSRAMFNRLTGVLRSRALSRLSRHLIRPDVLQPDATLGLPLDNYIAFRKLGDDVLGNGSEGTRGWNQHIDF
jgi:predicted O-methyltransferase YrrM